MNSIAWSTDGKTLASGSWDGTVRLWEASSGRELRRLEGHSDSVTSVAWSPDGKTLASGSWDNTVRLWEATSGRELRRLEGHSGYVTSVAWSPDGKTLASGSLDKTVRLWEASSGRELPRLEGHSSSVTSVAWSPDGKTLASGSWDNTVRLWEASSGRELRRLEGHSGLVYSVAWSPDGTTLASGSEDNTVRLWEASSGRELPRLEGHSYSVTSVAWSPDGETLASGSQDNTVRLWEASSGRELRRLEGHSGLVYSVAWSPDGTTLASGSWDNTVRLWVASSGRELRRLEGHSRSVTSVAWSRPDGKTLASGSEDNTVRLWEASSGRELRRLEGHSNSVTSVAWSPDGTTLASGSEDNTVRLWEASSGRELPRLEGHSSYVTSVAWSPDGTTLASGSWDNTVRLWEVSSRRELRRLEGHSGLVYSVAWSPDGKSLASGSQDNTVRLWKASSGRELRRLEGHSNSVTSVAWSPAGKTLASGSTESILWDSIGPREGRVSAILWSGADGWVAWRASEPLERRVLRGENGNLLRRVGSTGVLESIPPKTGLHPKLLARAEPVRAAEQGTMGELAIDVSNSEDATVAIWVEVEAPKETSEFLYRLPPIALRVDPGQTTRLSVEYARHAWANPKPTSANVTFSVHHAYDEGKPLEVPAELAFRSADLQVKAERPILAADIVDVTLNNTGTQATGRNLTVSARFVLADGRTVESDFKTVYETGLAPNETKSFPLTVPDEARDAAMFTVQLTAEEGIAAGIEPGSNTIGFVSHWTQETPPLPRRLWPLYLGVGVGMSLLLGGGYFVRVYRDPTVVKVAKDATALLQLPLPTLPAASQALERAHRLDGALGELGLSAERWRQTLGVVREPALAAQTLSTVLGAKPLSNGVDAPALLVDLPPLHLRFGPRAALAVVTGAHTEPGQAERIANSIVSTGLKASVILDLTQAQDARKAFSEVARFDGVVLSASALRDVLLAKHPVRALEAQVARQRPLRELSPYRTSGGAGPFFGRVDELRHLADRILHNALVVGPRQMGKSSLIQAVRRRLETRGDVDVRYVVLATDDLMGELAASLSQPRPETLQGFRTLVQGTRERPRLWLIDEADKFAQVDLARSGSESGAVSWTLRALAEEGTTYFVLVGFWELFHASVFDTKSPLRNFGELLRLGPLDADSATRLIREPMQSLGITVDDKGVADILQQTGRRANLVVLACQGLLEELAADQRVITRAQVEAVWRNYGYLRDALSYWREAPLDRAVGHAALKLGRATRTELEACLASAGIQAGSVDLDLTFQRLELGYVLHREPDAHDGPERWSCPVPLIARFESQIMGWDEHLKRDASQLAQGAVHLENR